MIYIKLSVLFAVLGVVLSQTSNNSNSSSVRIDDYLNVNKRQFSLNIWFYQLQINSFKEEFLLQTETLNIQRDYLKDVIIQTFERLYALTILSDFSKSCVNKYISLIPPVASVEAAIQRCIVTANNQLNTLIAPASATNRTLQTYYDNTFEAGVRNCKTRFTNTSSTNYTICIVNAVTSANVFTTTNQKLFNSQMDTAHNTARTIVKISLDCNFSVHNNTLSLIAGANTSINRCLQGFEDCSRCQSNECKNIRQIASNEVSYRNQTMRNVFLGFNAPIDCLLLKVL